jgi:hypothetical protein
MNFENPFLGVTLAMAIVLTVGVGAKLAEWLVSIFLLR